MIRTRQSLWQQLSVLLAKWDGAAAGARSQNNRGAADAYEKAGRDLAEILEKANTGEYAYAWGAASYPPDTVFTRHELAAALQCSDDTIERGPIPASYALGPRSPRYVWRQVVAFLEKGVDR